MTFLETLGPFCQVTARIPFWPYIPHFPQGYLRIPNQSKESVSFPVGWFFWQFLLSSQLPWTRGFPQTASEQKIASFHEISQSLVWNVYSSRKMSVSAVGIPLGSLIGNHSPEVVRGRWKGPAWDYLLCLPQQDLCSFSTTQCRTISKSEGERRDLDPAAAGEWMFPFTK